MSRTTDAIRAHHREIADRIAETTAHVTDQVTTEDLDELLRVLREDLLPHARGEDAELYPLVDPVVAARGRPTATMTVDHEHIGSYVKAIGVAAERVRASDDAARPSAVRDLYVLVRCLRAILDLHLDKEERVYLPLIEQHVPEDEQRRLLERMHEAATSAVEDERTLDVRAIAPARRHGLIFETFGALAEGGSFVLVNDHDPKPLYYQFAAEMPGTFTWEYLERGPDWRVRIGRTARAA